MNNIKELAGEKGIKISEIVQATGLSKSYVYDVINGKSIPTINVAQRIAKALKVSMTEVFPDTSSEKMFENPKSNGQIEKTICKGG